MAKKTKWPNKKAIGLLKKNPQLMGLMKFK